jgi:hypothetical protein
MRGLAGRWTLVFIGGVLVGFGGCSTKEEVAPPKGPSAVFQGEGIQSQSTNNAKNEASGDKIVEELPPKVILKNNPNKSNSNKPTNGTLLRLQLKPGLVWDATISADISASFDPSYLPPSEPSSTRGRLRVSLKASVKEARKESARLSSHSSKITLTSTGNESDVSSYPEQKAEVVVDSQARLLARELGLFRWIHYMPYLPFPEEPVVPKDRWMVESAHTGSILLGEGMALPADYTLQETYVLESQRRYDGRRVWEIKGETVSRDGKFRATGTYYVDVKTGLVVFAQVKQEAEVEAPYPNRGKVPATFTGNITVRAKIQEPPSPRT